MTSAAGAQAAGPRFTPEEAQVRKWLAKSASDYQVLGYSRAEILGGPLSQDVRLRIEELLKWARKLEGRQAAGEAKELGKRAVIGAQYLKGLVEKDWSGHLQQQKLLLLEDDLKNSCTDDNMLDWDEHLSVYEKAEVHGITRQDVDTILQKKLPDWQREVGAPIEVETREQFVGRTAKEFVRQNQTQPNVLSDLRREDLVKAIARRGIDASDARRLVDECLQSLGVRVEAGVWHGTLTVGGRQARSLREFHAALASADAAATAMDMFKRRAYSPMLRFAGEDEKVVLAVEAAENDVSRDGILAVLRFCWATGYRSLFIGRDEAKSVEDVVRLCDGAPERLRDHLTSRKLAVWLEEALGYGARSVLVRTAAEAGVQARDVDLQCLRWLWLAGENRLSVRGGGGPFSSVTDLVTWSSEAPGRVEELGRLVETSWLAGWLEGLASRDSRLSGLVDSAHPPAEDLSKEHAGWNFIWSAGHRSIHLWINGEHIEISKQEDLGHLLLDPGPEVVGLFRQGIVQDWLALVAESDEVGRLLNALRTDVALKGDPDFAAQYSGWALFSLPLRWAGAGWADLNSLVAQFERDARPLIQAWESGHLPYWLGCRFPKEVRGALENAKGDEKPEVMLNRVMWCLGSKILHSQGYPVHNLPDVWELPESAIEEMVRSDILPLWLAQVRGDETMAGSVRAVFASSSKQIRTRAVCWAMGSKSLRVGDHNPGTVQDLLNVADQVRPELRELLRDGTLGTWLSARRASAEILKHLTAEEIKLRDELGLDALLEYVLVALGLPPPVLKVEPSSVQLGRVREGVGRTIDIKIKNAGSRGILWATVTASGSVLSPATQFVQSVACGNEAHVVFILEFPVGGVPSNERLSFSVVSNGGQTQIPVKVTAGVAWAAVLVPSLGLGAAAATLAAMIRSGIASMVDDTLAKSWVDHASEVGAAPAVVMLLAGIGYGCFRYLGKNK